MQTLISDTHDSHGLVFTLNLLLGTDNEDGKTLEFIKKQAEIVEAIDWESLFYIREVLLVENGLAIVFSENSKRMARVDGLWNPGRNDQKFPVLLLDERAEEYNNVPHFSCHWCKEDVYGVHREAVVVYDTESKKMKLV